MYTPRERVIRLLLRILNNPQKYTRPQLAEHFGVNKEAIYNDIKAINNIPELEVHYENYPYRCYLEVGNSYRELDFLSPLSTTDKTNIKTALRAQNGSSKVAEQIISKVEKLYDFQRLGLRQLRHPAIERLNRLEGAKKSQKQVRLIRYRSNNNSIKDRIIEAFYIDTELDTLQAFDVTRNDVRHFRINRIERVEILDTNWQHHNRHQHKNTDVFRIANNNQQQVIIKLSVMAYNLLLEQYPTASRCTEPDGTEKDTFIFQGLVNEDFKGLINFLMGHSDQIEVLSPISLKEKMRAVAEEILKKNIH